MFDDGMLRVWLESLSVFLHTSPQNKTIYIEYYL